MTGASKRAPPLSCFWELNRRCELGCRHCRAEAGPEGDAGLPQADALSLADQLVSLGVRVVILTGGEPSRYPGWEAVARRLAEGGVTVRLFTNGVGLGEAEVERALRAGVAEFSLSLDGPSAIHDELRPWAGPGRGSAFDEASSAARAILGAGAPLWVVTQVSRVNLQALDETYELLLALGARRWLVHLCQATGRALGLELCRPADLEAIVAVLLRAAAEGRIVAPMTCSVGYLVAEDLLLRGRGEGRRPLWRGCDAGRTTLALTPAGEVKGCTTLPDEFVTASALERPLAELWADDALFPFTRAWTPELLAGPCARCALAKRCRAGCPAVAYGATGAVGANPYCLRLVRGL